MPPYVSRKRHRSPSPAPTPPSKRSTPAKPAAKRAKPTLFETVDAPSRPARSLSDSRKLLAELNEDDDDDSLSEADSEDLDFEDVPPAKKRKIVPKAEGDGEEEDDDEMDWEDAIPSKPTPMFSKAEPEIGDISISMTEDGAYIAPPVSGTSGAGKKGPSKRERRARVQAHCLHVQSLMWHNTVRNSWLNDKDVQKTLVEGLTEGVKREVTRWREAMGTLSKDELEAKKKAAAAKGKGKKGRKSKDKAGRDWSYDAQHSEQFAVNLSAGDPLLRLLKVLTAYWRKRFTITAPGLRKQGYKPLRRLRDEIKAWEKDRADAEEHGERIESVADFRKLARKCEGSRDVGAQLFVALMRGVGLETRMVANLQPVGFGWSKAEEADAKKVKGKADKKEKTDDESEAAVEEKLKGKLNNPQLKKALTPKQSKKEFKEEKPDRKSARGNKAQPINLENDSDSALSSPPSGEASAAEDANSDSDLSVIDLDPPLKQKKPTKKYDRDLPYPIYWSEVCSPVSHKRIPVDPIVLSTIASNDELLQTFEPRGKKAEKAKQVMAYIVAFNADGSGKDVTCRYLKKHQFPGKTKGVRMPVEKVPVYNRKGKVRRYEEYDWFRTVMSLYDRPENKRTAADDLEEQTDLKPWKPAKEAKEVEKESLQWYKQSADYVLEQHLRREEAILPDSEPVKTFIAGKGEKAKEHPVFRRADVVVCMTTESWHKRGREVKIGEQPLKYVPMRAVTLNRKREIEDAVRETGEKLQQGLYSEEQTDWIIPPPIKDGRIPRNAFGNMDVYVPTMVPKGAVHLPLKGSAKLCRKLEIDYAEACTGFEFGKQRAVPVLTGVVVAEEHEILVRDAWREEQKEIKRKEDTKRTGVSLHWWRKMVMGLRIVERMRTEYADSGGGGEEVNPFVNKAKREGRAAASTAAGAEMDVDDDMGGGGFFPPGHDEEEVPQRSGAKREVEEQHEELGGGFLVSDGEEGGGFLVEEQLHLPQEEQKAPPKGHAPITPVSLQSMHKGTDVTNDESALSSADSDDDVAGTDSTKIRRPERTTKPANRKSAKLATTSKPKRPSKVVKVADSVDKSMSDLSDVSSSIHDIDNSEAASSSDEEENFQTRRKSSPKVVVTPQKLRQARQIPSRVGKKSTPLRSKYFAHDENDGSEDVGEEVGSDDESEEEVVRPRKTTARTRIKA